MSLPAGVSSVAGQPDRTPQPIPMHPTALPPQLPTITLSPCLRPSLLASYAAYGTRSLAF